MFDGPLMLRVNWPVVYTVHPQSNKFATGVKMKATGVKIKATGELKLNDIPTYHCQSCSTLLNTYFGSLSLTMSQLFILV